METQKNTAEQAAAAAKAASSANPSAVDAEQRLAELKAAHAKEKETAIQEAVASVTQTLRAELAAPSPTIQKELTDRHAAELAALESRLSQKYAVDLAAATSSVPRLPEADVEKVVQDRLAQAVKDAVPREQHEKDLKVAMENGRKELQARMKIKDAQAVKQAMKMKELEAKIVELETASGVTASIPPTPTPIASTSSLPPKPPPAGPAAATLATSALPAKALPTGPANASETATRGRGRGRGRGVAVRGGAGRGAGAAAAASAVLASVDSATPNPGLSIIGAASAKRGRDEPEASEPVAKRLRGSAPPADLATAAKPGAPVTINRTGAPGRRGPPAPPA